MKNNSKINLELCNKIQKESYIYISIERHPATEGNQQASGNLAPVMFSSLLSSGHYMVVDRVKSRTIMVDSVFGTFAVGYTPSVGDVTINLSKLEKGLAERRYRLKLIGVN